MRTNKKDKIILKIPTERRILIIGMGETLRLLVELAGQYLISDSVFIISRRNNDPEDEKRLKLLAGKYNFSVDFVDDINAKDTITKIKKTQSNICINYGGLWIFKEEVISLFNGLFFNCHAANLPDYRGPGDYGWEILNREKSVSVIIHQLVRRVDAGAILIKKTKKFKKKNIYPIDFHNAVRELRKDTFRSFLELVCGSTSFILTPQNDEVAAYWPRLKSSSNGAINLNWSKEEIKLFVCAFSEPLEGAFLFYRGQKIFIKEIEISFRRKQPHPFLRGLIVNRTDDHVEVIVRDGSILFKKVYDQKGEKIPFGKFRPGDRLSMPVGVLNRAMMHNIRRDT